MAEVPPRRCEPTIPLETLELLSREIERQRRDVGDAGLENIPISAAQALRDAALQIRTYEALRKGASSRFEALVASVQGGGLDLPSVLATSPPDKPDWHEDVDWSSQPDGYRAEEAREED